MREWRESRRWIAIAKIVIGVLLRRLVTSLSRDRGH